MLAELNHSGSYYLCNPPIKRAVTGILILFLPMLFLTSVREKRTAFLEQWPSFALLHKS